MGDQLEKSAFLIEHIAILSAQWVDEERLKFIWNNHLIVGHYNRDKKFFDVLTYVGEDERDKIRDWFYRMTHNGLLTNEEMEEDGQQENWD